jgi:hypothetical protein
MSHPYYGGNGVPQIPGGVDPYAAQHYQQQQQHHQQQQQHLYQQQQGKMVDRRLFKLFQ